METRRCLILIRIQNQANPDNTQYLSGKPNKEDRYYNTTQLSALIYEMAQIKGQDETIQYLEDKIKQIKAIQGGGK